MVAISDDSIADPGLVSTMNCLPTLAIPNSVQSTVATTVTPVTGPVGATGFVGSVVCSLIFVRIISYAACLAT